jgi:uncharacterized delta-60 repeat protein
MRNAILLLLVIFCYGRLAAQPGTQESTYPGGVGPNGQVYAMAVDPDNKVVIAGNFGAYNGTTRLRVARVNTDGSNDVNFTPGTGANALIWDVKRTSGGQYYIAGNFTTFSGSTRTRVARLNSNGALDANFDPGIGPNAQVRSVATQSSGKLIIAGDFLSFAGNTSVKYIARLNTDGSLDNTFLGSNSFNNVIRSVVIQPDDKIIVVGQFTGYNGSNFKYIVRMNADGSLDNSFAVGTGFNDYTQSLALQPDGRVLVGGVFTAFNGAANVRRRIARLTSTGGLDGTFDAGLGVTDWVYGIKVQPDGKVLISGDFTTAAGNTVGRIARLNANGIYDASFSGGTGASTTVRGIEIINQRILIIGDYLTYNGTSKRYLTRLYGDNSATVGGLLASYCTSATVSIPYTASGTFDAGNVFTAQISDASGSFASPVTIGTVASTGSGSISVTLPASSGSGYRFRINSSAPASTGVNNGSNITIGSGNSASISYAGSPYCGSTGTATPQLTGTNDGSYSSTAGLSINATTGAINIGASTAGNYTVMYDNGTGCGAAATATVVIRPTLAISSQPNQVLCAGINTGAANFSLVPGLSYGWTNDNTSIGLGASGTGNIGAFTTTNATTQVQVANITVMATGGTECTFKPMIYRYSVKPRPTVTTPADQSVCAGALVSVNFAGNLSGTTYSWTNANTATGLGGAGTGNISSFSVVNNTGVLQTSYVAVTPYNNGCVGGGISFAINVSPSAGTISYAGSPYCQAGAAYATRTGSTGGTYSANPAGLNLNATTGSVNLALSQPGTYTVTYTVSASGGCSATANAQIIINAQASVNPQPNPVYCNGFVTNPIVFTGTAASYNWTNDNTSIGLGASGSGNIPGFTTVNNGPGVQYATIRVTPQGNGSTTCSSKPVSFRITVNFCPPVSHSGDTGGDGSTGRISTGLQVSPNPAHHTITIQMGATSSHPLHVQISDASGNPVTRSVPFAQSVYQVDISALRPGSYVVEITDRLSGSVQRRTFIKL